MKKWRVCGLRLIQMSGIFISYRREDSGPYSGRLFDVMANHFGRESVFMDLDSINPGEDFREVIQRASSACEVLLAVIGKQWTTVRDRAGKPRLDNESDYVRMEIAAALKKGLRVIPVLVGGAEMPEESELPPDLRALKYRNAWEISDRRFHQDVELLVEALSKISGATPQPQPASTPPLRKPRVKSLLTDDPPKSLFPLYGITLGKTTLAELAQKGSTAKDISDSTGEPYLYYQVNGMNFWYDKDSGLANRIYITYTNKLPQAWEQLGFRWENSYEQWLSVLRNAGYSIKIKEKPHTKLWQKRDSFSAMVLGKKNDPVPHEIELDFSYSKGTTQQAPSTLYSIAVLV